MHLDISSLQFCLSKKKKTKIQLLVLLLLINLDRMLETLAKVIELDVS